MNVESSTATIVYTEPDQLQSLPDELESVLADFGLMAAFRSLPPYRQGDYVVWIESAQRAQTREARVADMLDELADLTAGSHGSAVR